MSQADIVYSKICKEILDNGIWDKGTEVRTRWESDGTPAYSKAIRKATMFFDNSEVPILTSKKVGVQTPIKEGLKWIWQDKSNDVEALNKMGVHIWDNWRRLDNSIGKAYGYQLGKKTKKVYWNQALETMLVNGYLSGCEEFVDHVLLDQVDYLLYQLKVNPSSRRHITMLWNWDDIDDMALTPCVYETQWILQENKLHLVVGIRSNDMALGNPYNIYQYSIIQRCIAQVTGYELGTIEFEIKIPHIYERHIEGIQHQLTLPTYEAPTLWINPEIKSFYDFKIEDIRIENYQCGPSIFYEVAE